MSDGGFLFVKKRKMVGRHGLSGPTALSLVDVGDSNVVDPVMALAGARGPRFKPAAAH